MVKILTVGKDLDKDRAFALHNACFGDEREWFDAFLNAAYGQTYLVYGDYNGGMFLLDVTFDGYEGKYVYALGVLPLCRGKGIAKELLKKAKAISKDFTLICAADEGLAAAYERCGFDRYVGGTVKAGSMRGADFYTSAYKIPCAYADIHGGILLNERLFKFALSESGASLFTDGKAIVAKAASGVYAAYGLPPTVHKKAQMHLEKDIDTSGAIADLILEI